MEVNEEDCQNRNDEDKSKSSKVPQNTSKGWKQTAHQQIWSKQLKSSQHTVTCQQTMKNTMEDNQVVGLEPSNLSYSDNNLNNIKDVEECNQDTI